MKYYLMKRQMTPTGALIYLDSHELTNFKTGISLGTDFVAPVSFKLDSELGAATLPTFFSSPAIVSLKCLVYDLEEIGVNNFEVYTAVIEDEASGRKIPGYSLVNIVGLVSCADMNQSDYEAIDDDGEMIMINKLVLNQKKVRGLDLFHVAEDTDCIVVSEKVYLHLIGKAYGDIYFEELGV